VPCGVPLPGGVPGFRHDTVRCCGDARDATRHACALIIISDHCGRDDSSFVRLPTGPRHPTGPAPDSTVLNQACLGRRQSPPRASTYPSSHTTNLISVVKGNSIPKLQTSPYFCRLHLPRHQWVILWNSMCSRAKPAIFTHPMATLVFSHECALGELATWAQLRQRRLQRRSTIMAHSWPNPPVRTQGCPCAG
jgi:hypothetical protein